jgi:6-hydroxynicotinate 3-monooxygenase
MSIDGRRVAVIGAGIGGLTVAAALRQLGIDADVYEQASRFTRLGAGIHVAPNAVHGLMGAGLPISTLTKVPAHPTYKNHRDAYSGEVSSSMQLGPASWREFSAPYTLWHRGDLHEALTHLVSADRLHLGMRLLDLQEHSGGVTLRFADGTTAEADIVIASDGLHSTVRQHVFALDDAVNTGKVAYRAVLDRSRVSVDLDPCTKWWGADRHFVHYIVSAGREVAFTTSIADDDWAEESWNSAGDPEILRAAFADFHPTVRAILDAVERVNKWALHTRAPLDCWSHGRVVLIGDAAHTMPPYMGQGGAQSIEDAVVLARALSEAAPDDAGVAGAFAVYEATRRDRATLIQETSAANAFMRYDNDGGWVYGYDPWTAPLAEALVPVAAQ